MRVRAGLLAGLLLVLAAAESAQARPSRQFYGVVPQAIPAPVDFERMGHGGVGTLRYVFGWSKIMPTSDVANPDWRELDYVVALAARNGMTVLPGIFGTPEWLSESEGCQTRCSVTPPQTEEGLLVWQGLFAALAHRYGPGGEFWDQHPELPQFPVRTWQVWNEPNSAMFYAPRPDVFSYARLVVNATTGLRGQDPGARVILGGMFGTPNTPIGRSLTAWDFLQGLYAVGLDPWFEGVAIHPYGRKMARVRKQISRLRDVIRSYGTQPASLWITELGWTSGGDTPLNRGRRGQADRLEQSFRYLTRARRKLNLKLIAWFAWRDTPRTQARCGWCSWAGLFRSERLTAKPAWRAFVRFTGGR
jgi:hypothetical protein